ncbi:MAG: hypothetical protein ACFFDC_12065 [Promethearchaeota archaeon]
MFKIIAQVGSAPPIQAVIMEGFVLIVFAYLSLQTGLKFKQSRAIAVRNLFLSFFAYFLAGSTLFSTKAIEYYTGGVVDVSSLGINCGYAFSALGNLFLFYFTLDIFFKEVKPYFREIITLATGVVEGFLIIFIFRTESPFLEIPGEYLPFQLLLWHGLVSSVIFLILFSRSYSEWKKATRPVPKVGFLMISISAIFELLVFIFFILDSFFPAGYSLFYFLGWTSASLAGCFAMIGYLMPNWFKNLVQSRIEN